MDSLRVSAIIQARMGSTRLPGKVLMPLAGRPVLWHITYRLKKCRTIDDIVVATSDLKEDDKLAAWCSKNDIPVFRGSEENVLQRFALAIRSLDPEFIIRICGDSPMVDPQVIDQLVTHLVKTGADHCIGDKKTPTIHEGFSPFSRQAFERLLAEAPDDPVAIEHVTAYFGQHPENFETTTIPMPREHWFSGARMSIDTPADLHFMNEIYARLDVPAGEADMADVVRLLKDNPDLLSINNHVHQKAATDKTFKAVIRCDGDEQIGLGHVVRCLALAEELRDSQSVGVSFAMVSGKPGMDLVRNAGFPVIPLTDQTNEDVWLGKLIRTRKPNALILDVRSSLSPALVRQWRENGLLIATIDDPSDRRLEADLAFYPPVPQVKEMDWSGFTGQLFVGWEWVLLRNQFARSPEFHGRVSSSGRSLSHPPELLITMGGSDPAGLTLKAIRALNRVKSSFHATVILGSGFTHDDELLRLLEKVTFPYKILRNVEDMAEVMKKSDLALSSFGGTAYELAACGVPGIFFALTDDHARSAGLFEKQGIGINLGVHDSVFDQDVVRAVESLIQNLTSHDSLVKNCLKKMDGQGAKRMANKIYQNVAILS
ncbi:MAG: NTP transferase domain-containing protein [Desulfotignum sp.]|nr:NTP transferase domain-containing protein [Desulfotignum sp.]MCF8136413.1 NTP transferase domain-containing protein [Desulfotignum sp.]